MKDEEKALRKRCFMCKLGWMKPIGRILPNSPKRVYACSKCGYREWGEREKHG